MHSERGFTLTEVLVAMSLAAILSGMAALNLMELSDPAYSAASEISGYLKRVRAKALATTSAYTISASTTDTLIATFGNTCAGAQTDEPELTLVLENADLTDVSWELCFTSRGFPNANVLIPVVDSYSGNRTVEVLLGGSIRVQ